MAEVYWAARDLASSPVGNHQYIVIMLNAGETLSGIQTQQENGKNFVTLGGHVAGSTSAAAVWFILPTSAMMSLPLKNR